MNENIEKKLKQLLILQKDILTEQEKLRLQNVTTQQMLVILQEQQAEMRKQLDILYAKMDEDDYRKVGLA